MDYEVATAAANWWITQMKKRCKELHPHKVTGSDSDIVVVDSCLSAGLSRFQKEFLEYAKKSPYGNLTFCYHANRDLSRLLKQAGISDEYLPSRAQMQLLGNHVEVSVGDSSLQKLPLHKNNHL